MSTARNSLEPAKKTGACPERKPAVISLRRVARVSSTFEGWFILANHSSRAWNWAINSWPVPVASVTEGVPSARRRQVCNASFEFTYRKAAELTSTTVRNVNSAISRGTSMLDSLDLDRDQAFHDEGSCHHEETSDHDHRLTHWIREQQPHV